MKLGLAAFLAGVILAAGAEGRPPNIVHFLIDEQGYYELSGMGHPDFQTPNVDRLAAEGLRFTQMLAGGPVCAPTRCVLQTGKHLGHASVRTNGGGTPLRAGEATIASVLQGAGYATGGFGKWGCGNRGTTGVPERHGFDVFFGYYDQVHAHTYYPPYLIRNSEEVPLPGNITGGRTGQTYSHYRIVEEAKAFIRANRGRPFYAYLPFTPPHGMFDIPESDPSWALYKDKDWPNHDVKAYAAMVNMVDRQVGEVMALLKELGLEQDTLVIYSGDNGGMDYFRDPRHPRGFFAPNVNPKTGQAFRGQKGDLYEGGLRVPFLVRWPGHVAPGGVSDHLGYFADLLPTLAALADVPAPPDIDGLSFAPTLLGAAAGGAQLEHPYLYWESPGHAAVRMKNWKAVRAGKQAPWQLFDLARDPGEQRDVSAAQPEILARMKAQAAEAHVDGKEGDVLDRALYEKDHRSTFSDKKPAARSPAGG